MKVNISPVITSHDYKVICVSGNHGDILERHKVNESGILLVKKGSIHYQEEGGPEIKLMEGEGQNIPAEIHHEVRCIEAAEVFVIIPQKAKMRFAK